MSRTPRTSCTTSPGARSNSAPPVAGAMRRRCPATSKPTTVPVWWLSPQPTATPRSNWTPDSAPLPPVCRWLRRRPLEPLTERLQIGQVAERWSHSVTHDLWNKWSQSNRRTTSSSAKSERQTMHWDWVSVECSARRHRSSSPQFARSADAKPCPLRNMPSISLNRLWMASSCAIVLNNMTCKPRGNRRNSLRISGGKKSQTVGRNGSPSL
mmetsp:Transcript_47729/g.137474  ORF Transcript_47729/g.137474 Transcript_47729/m.137474 type:complete len:211 (-) Transcript_47729:348-980(-)